MPSLGNLTKSCPHCAISQDHVLLVMIEKMKSAHDNKEFRTARDDKEFRAAILRDLSKVLTYLSRCPYC